MKTAIIYRSNPLLDTMLKPFEDKVSLFHAFPSETSEAEIRSLLSSGPLAERLYYVEEVIDFLGVEILSTNFNIFCDLTVFSSLQGNSKGKAQIIRQTSKTPHEEYVKSVVQEASDKNIPLLVVKQNLADHCELEGIDPYQLKRQDTEDGGWYLDKVISIWEKVCAEESVQMILLSGQLETSNIDRIIVCGHHNRNCSNLLELSKVGRLALRSAYSACPYEYKYVTTNDIPIF